MENNDTCPQCGSESVYYCPAEVQGTIVIQEAACDDCGAGWHAVYEFARIVLDELGE